MIDIKDIDGNIRFSTPVNKGGKRKFTLMKEDYITLKFSLDIPLNFKLGDSVEDTFGLFELMELYKPAYNKETGGYEYELRLDAYYWKWKNKIFKFTPEKGGQEAAWNLTAPLDTQMDVFLRNLNALGYTYKGKVFEYTIDNTVNNSAKLMSYDSTNMIDALSKMAEAWECEWWVTDSIIHFGRLEHSDPVDFEIGVNVEEMTCSDGLANYATRIYAFGSTRNLPANYRPVNESVVVNGVVQRRLMLPASTPYIDAYPNMRMEETVEQVVIFDDIYPRRVGTMVGITTHEYTDKVEEEGKEPVYRKWNAYRFKDTEVMFSKDYILPNEELKITFQSGKLNGMTFAVIFNPCDKEGGEAPKTEKLKDGSLNPAAQVWEIIRNEDYGRELPGDVLIPRNGDKYVLSGWDASKISEMGLVAAAELELKEKAEVHRDKVKIDPSTYTNRMMCDKDFMMLDAGARVNLINKAFFDTGSRQSRIIGFEYNLDIPYDHPVYTVGETASYSRIAELENKIESITLKGQTYTGGGGSGIYLIKSNDTTPASDSNTYSAKRIRKEIEERAISRIKPDITQEIITFLKGLLIGNKGHGITLSASGVVTAILDELKNVFTLVSPGFVSGDLGNGFILKYAPETGRSYFEVDELLVRKIAYFVELVIKQLRHVGGEIILTPASMTCIKVEELEDVYRCYFQADDGTRSVMQEFVAGDQARCQTFNIKPGTSHNVTNKYYWRLVTAVGDDYIDLSKTDCDTGSGVPAAKDDIVQLGNRTDATRQNAIILSTVGDDAPSIKQYKGIDGYTLAGKEVTILSATLNKFIGRFVSEVTGRSYDDLMSELQADMELIHSQTDKEYTLWFFEYDPALNNIPASDWTTTELKEMHEQDMFYNRTTGHAWRFEKNADGSFSWNGITDQLTLKALENAAKAQDTADGKRQVFVVQPTDAQAYEVGDQWVNATYDDGTVSYDNDLLVCITAKAAGVPFSISHWRPANSITTAGIKNLGDSIEALAGRFNADGSLKNTSGLVVKPEGSGIFVQQADGSLALIGVAVAENGQTVIKLGADSIRLEGYTTVNDGFSVNEEGKVTMKDATANNLTLSGDIKGNNATLNDITLNNITANSGTFNGTVNADSGRIGGFKISGNGLTNDPFANDAYVIFRNDYYKCFAGIGGNVLPSTSGMRAVGRFENDDAHDQWKIGRNIALLLSAKNGVYNHAFCGEGNGTLNGWIGGYKYSKFNLTSANTIYNGYSNLKDNNRWIIHSSADGSGVTLPRLPEVREALGIGSDTKFCVEFTILADLDSKTFDIYGRNGKKDSSGGYPWKASEYPNLVHWNNDHWDNVTMYAGDSLTVLLVYDSGKSGSKGGYPLTYTARVINRQD